MHDVWEKYNHSMNQYNKILISDLMHGNGEYLDLSFS